MSYRLQRKTDKKSIRSMLTFVYYHFKQYLKHQAEEYGKQIVDVNEAYASKTASWTGEVKENLSSKKFIRSQVVTVYCDLNGARSIMLRALRASSIDAV